MVEVTTVSENDTFRPTPWFGEKRAVQSSRQRKDDIFTSDNLPFFRKMPSGGDCESIP